MRHRARASPPDTVALNLLAPCFPVKPEPKRPRIENRQYPYQLHQAGDFSVFILQVTQQDSDACKRYERPDADDPPVVQNDLQVLLDSEDCYFLLR